MIKTYSGAIPFKTRVMSMYMNDYQEAWTNSTEHPKFLYSSH